MIISVFQYDPDISYLGCILICEPGIHDHGRV